MRTRMIAVAPMNYGTRRLRAGDEFYCDGPMSRVLEIAGQACLPAKSRAAPAPAPSYATRDINAARTEYQRIYGKRPWMGWPLETVLAKIAAAKC